MNSARKALLHEAVDRQAAESFRIEPVIARYGASSPGGQSIDVNARPLPDPDRGAVTFSGIWTEPSVRTPVGSTPSARETHGGAMRHPSLSRPAIKYDDRELPWRPSVGDLVTRLETGDRFSVAEIHIDGFGRVILFLTARTAA